MHSSLSTRHQEWQGHHPACSLWESPPQLESAGETHGIVAVNAVWTSQTPWQCLRDTQKPADHPLKSTVFRESNFQWGGGMWTDEEVVRVTSLESQKLQPPECSEPRAAPNRPWHLLLKALPSSVWWILSSVEAHFKVFKLWLNRGQYF